MVAIPLTESGLLSAKRALMARFPSIKSSHLTEALAASCGHKTNAALRASMKGRNSSDPDFVFLDERSFRARIEEIAGLEALPSTQRIPFDEAAFVREIGGKNTYSPRFDKVQYGNSTRMRAWRNAMVAGINEALTLRLFTLAPSDNRWPGAIAEGNGQAKSYSFEFEFESIPAVASVFDAGFDELSIHVALWPTAQGKYWVGASGAGFLAGEVYSSGWLERRDGAWLQVQSDCGARSNFRCRQHRLQQVASLDVHPKGFADRGSFKL